MVDDVYSQICLCVCRYNMPYRPECYKTFSCSTELGMKSVIFFFIRDLVYLVFYQHLIKQRYMTNEMIQWNFLPMISFSQKRAWPHLMNI